MLSTPGILSGKVFAAALSFPSLPGQNYGKLKASAE
jgi:hypothetical protein